MYLDYFNNCFIVSGSGWHVFYFLSCLFNNGTVSIAHGVFWFLSVPTVFGIVAIFFICDTSKLGLFCNL